MTLFGRLFVLFVLLPVVELALLIQVGRQLGLWPTIGIVLATGALGAALARREGMRVFFGFQGELASGRLPHQALLDGVSVLVGGMLLLTPGFLTDALGFAFLLPASRRWIQGRVRRRLESGIRQGTVRVVSFGNMGGTHGAPDAADLDALSGLDPRHGIEVPPDDR
jgi:UPF0716 protein FxsA